MEMSPSTNHRWSVCKPAVQLGRELKLPIYKFLKNPLIRRFGQEWYDELLALVEALKAEGMLPKDDEIAVSGEHFFFFTKPFCLLYACLFFAFIRFPRKKKRKPYSLLKSSSSHNRNFCACFSPHQSQIYCEDYQYYRFYPIC